MFSAIKALFQVPKLAIKASIITGYITYHQWEKNIYSDQQYEESFCENDIETTIPKILFATETAQISKFKLICGSGNHQLSSEISAHLDVSPMRVSCKSNESHESEIEIYDECSGDQVFVIQSIEPPYISDKMMELLLTVATLKRSGASKVVAVVPYIAFGRQRGNERQPLDQSQTVCQLLSAVGCDTVITINFETSSIKGFFPPQCQVLNIDVAPIAIPHLKYLNSIVLIPHTMEAQQIKRTANLRDEFNQTGQDCQVAFITNKMQYIGQQLVGKNCVLYDSILKDIPQIIEKGKLLKELGANRVVYFSIHGSISDNDLEKINESSFIDQILITNTVSSDAKSDKLIQLSVSKLLAEIVSVIQTEKSLEYNRNHKSFINKYLK